MPSTTAQQNCRQQVQPEFDRGCSAPCSGAHSKHRGIQVACLRDVQVHTLEMPPMGLMSAALQSYLVKYLINGLLTTGLIKNRSTICVCSGTTIPPGCQQAGINSRATSSVLTVGVCQQQQGNCNRPEQSDSHRSSHKHSGPRTILPSMRPQASVHHMCHTSTRIRPARRPARIR